MGVIEFIGNSILPAHTESNESPSEGDALETAKSINNMVNEVDRDSRRPSVLIVAAKWWPLSARLASALVRHGCRVTALCPAGHPLTHLSTLDGIRRYGGIRSLSSLSRAIKATQPHIVVPCDDGVVAQLHALHRREPALREVIQRSLGSPQSFPVVSSRYRLLTTALGLGIAVPETRQAESTEDLVHWHQNMAQAGILKLDGESGGNGVRICGSLRESLAAWQDARRPLGFATAWKRLAVDGDPLALWTPEGRVREITIQRIIHGRPANSMLACRNGRVLSQISVVVLASDGPTGASTIVQRIRDDRMERAANLLAARLQLTGFYGLDFMIEASTGTPYLIEMNPRCTQLGHLEFADQGSLAGAFSADLRGEPPSPAQRPIPAGPIALYPQSLHALSNGSRFRNNSYLDVPWEEPGIADEFKLGPLPHRRWPARLYHSVKPLRRQAGMEYEDFAVTFDAGLADL